MSGTGIDVRGGLAPAHVLRDIRDSWVAALQSYRFTQGKHRLHVYVPDGRDEFCAVGVLAEVLVEMGYADRHPAPFLDSYGYSMPGSYPGYRALPSPLHDFLGWDIHGTIPDPYPRLYCRTWYQLNDLGMPFARYAAVVDRFMSVGAVRDNDTDVEGSERSPT